MKSLGERIKTNYMMKPFACDVRKTEFTSNMKNEKKQFSVLGLCDEAVETTNDTTVYKKTNSEWNLFICHICDEVFPTSSGKLRHMRSHAEIKTFPITCEVCNKQFSRSDNLKRHMRTHYIHQCDICGVRCIDNMARLYNHMKTHSAEQAFNLNVWDCFLTEKK